MAIDLASLHIGPTAEQLVKDSFQWVAENVPEMHKRTVRAAILFSKENKRSAMIIQNLDGVAEKDAASAVIDNLRVDCDCVTFITEAWVAMNQVPHPHPGTPMNQEEFQEYAKQVEKEPPPEDVPNRAEVVMIALYIKARNVMFTAKIIRPVNPPPHTILEDWEIINDTAQGDMDSGRFT